MARATAKSNPNRVALAIPRGDTKGDPNLFISVGGKNYILPRGKTSYVPPEVAEEYYRSERAKEKYFTTAEALLERAK